MKPTQHLTPDVRDDAPAKRQFARVDLHVTMLRDGSIGEDRDEFDLPARLSKEQHLDCRVPKNAGTSRVDLNGQPGVS